MKSSRREFLGGALAASLAGASSAKNLDAVFQPLAVFDYGAVKLDDGPLKRQFDQNHAFFLNLSEDRLLKIYRERVGLPAPGANMGGWYDDFCPGASFGQYLSALARFSAATGSLETQAKVRRLVKGYAQTVDPSGRFFVDLRYPAYTYDKLVCGLIDAYQFADDGNAIATLYATTKAASPHMPGRALTREEQDNWPHKNETYTWDETYTLAENLFLAYERTGDKQFFNLGKNYLLDRTFFEPLSKGENILPGLHAYSHVNALSSGMQGYLKLGNEKYFRAVTNAIDMIWRDQSFATGGWGPNEAFVEPGSGQLGESLSNTHRSFETPCGAYAHFKVMRYLLTLTRDSRYGDSMEKVLYNTVLGAKPIQEDGSSFYYSDYHYSAHKTYKRVVPGAKYGWDRDDRWPCCSGTLPQVVADYVISAYFRSVDGIYVNLFVPSQLTWIAHGTVCSLRQATRYPSQNLTQFQINVSQPLEFAVYLRVPGWAGSGSVVAVNGTRVKEVLRPGSFFRVDRLWRPGDRIDFEIDQTVRTEAVDNQHPNQVALVRGPQVLFAVADQQPQLTKRQASSLQLKNAEGLDWQIAGFEPDMRFRPFADIGDEVYQTYLGITG